MHASPQKVVNRAPTPVVQRASSPVATPAGPGRALNSPHTARFAGSIVQRDPLVRHNPSGAQGDLSSDGGKRMYRTSDGKMVELPPDMTADEAAVLETEAKAATKQLGKGPQPQPVPDVKKLAKKGEKKEGAKPRAKGRALVRSSGKAAPKAGAAAAALLQAVGKSKVAQYLAVRGTPALVRGIGTLQRLRQNEQTHDDAAEKLTQSEKAVVIPASEGQSKSNTGQVSTVGDRPVPTVDEKVAKGRLNQTLEENTPRSIEDVDNFKRDMKAQHMGADVMLVVQGDKTAVTSTFGDMQQTPPPAPREHEPESLPPEEVAPSTPPLNLGQGTIAPLQKEHTDVSNFTKEADSKLKEEGVTQEQLDMVDNGDLAEANKEKKGLERAAKTEPLAVQESARQESEKIDKDLKQEEKRDRDGLRAKRKAGLSATAQKQKGTKSSLEKKRDEVAAKINGIYQAAQDKVKKKLADLEMQSIKRFDDGNARATKAFEDNVNRELDAYKADRYSGWFGWARKAKDWLLGMDDLPEVKAIFDRNRTAFVNTIGKLVDDITADNKRVIQECKDELAIARKSIQEYVDQLGPGLRDIGKKAAEEMNSKLNELDQFITQKEAELQTKLKDKQAAAIKAIDQKIEKMKEAMSGALAKLGKLLLWAAKKFFTWALQKFGYSLEEIEGIINKGAAVLKAIFTQPIRFVKNLIGAAAAGFQNFAKNFLTHLKNAIFDWLTGSLDGIQLPATWDLKGIASVAFQMLGLTWSNIRSKLVRVIGEMPVKALETGFELVVTLVKDGPLAAWEKIKEMADDIKAAFIEAVQDFIKIKIVQKAVETVLSLLIPGAGIIRAIVAIYDTVVFFIQKAKQIAQMIGNFLSSMGEIAMGNIGAAADALEKGLATALKLVINFLAKFLRLDGITAKIRAAIQKLRAKVDGMLDKVVAWIVAQAKRLGRMIVSGGRAAVARIREWWRVRRPFKTASGENHTIYFQGQGAAARVYVASEPRSVESVLNDTTIEIPDRAALQERLKKLQEKIAAEATAKHSDPKVQEREQETLQRHVEAELDYFAIQLAQHLGHVADLPPTAVTYRTGSDKRPMYVKAEPMTINPGNTTGSPADGNRDHVAGFKQIVSKWEQKTGEHTREGQKNPTLRSRVTGTHILSEVFHGPFTEAWNVVLTDQALNNRMTRGPEAEGKKHFKTAKLSYEVTLSYYTDDPPPPRAETVNTAEVPEVQNWVGYFIATNLQVVIKKWNKSNNAYSDVLFNKGVSAGLPPVRGERIPSLDEQIIAILKAHLVPGQDYTDPDGNVFVKTTYSGMDVRDEVRAQTAATDLKVAQMKREKRLYGPLGPGARLYLKKELT